MKSATAFSLFSVAFLAAAVGGQALAKDKKPAKTPEIPRCTHSLGTAAVLDAENNWWRYYDLGNPDALIKLMVMRSGCFQLVDRGRGMDQRVSERTYADSDELQRGSNVGKGQLKAADYFIIPDIVAEDRNAGGNNLGGVVGGLFGRKVGGILGSIKTKKLEAHTLLTVTNARTGIQELITEGTARKTDISFNIGAGLFGRGGGFGALGGGYADTEIGKVISAAYLDAYIDLVYQMGGMSDNAAAAAPIAAHEMVEKARMYQGPSEDSGVVRMLRQGALVYPLGARSDIFWEVEDTNGNRGWVSSEYLERAR